MVLSLPAYASSTGVWVAGWKETASTNTARAGAAAVRVKDKIYLIGGVSSGAHDVTFLNTTEYAQIKKDGALGQWRMGPALNVQRGFTAAVVHGDYVYVVGGGNGPNGSNYLRSAERARIRTDGTLGAWENEKNEMVLARRCSRLIITDKALYSLGGFSGAPHDSVESAEWQPDGSLGEWRLDPQTLTQPSYIDSVRKMGDVFFVVGGHDTESGAGEAEVEWSRPTADGTLQKWQTTTPLQQARYGHSTASYGEYMYALGGLFGAQFLDSIERTKAGQDGRLEPWQFTTPLDRPRANSSIIDYNGRLYVIGGAYPGGYLSSVVYADRNAAGDIGYWGSAEEAKAVQAPVTGTEGKLRLPSEGVAQEVLQTKAYTYVQVKSRRDGLVWLAGPIIPDLKPGDRVGYAPGSNMSNFFSRELQRTFPMVIFVSELQKQ